MKSRRPGDVLYALAVRDGPDLLLYCTIRRVKTGDIYVNLHGEQEKHWKPHASVHASGRRHHKSFGSKVRVTYGQKPDASFVGEENIVTIPISVTAPRAINDPCNANDFTDVFEIPQKDLRQEKYRTYVAVDVVAPGKSAIMSPGAKVLLDKTFKDSLPWILVTLFDTDPTT